VNQGLVRRLGGGRDQSLVLNNTVLFIILRCERDLLAEIAPVRIGSASLLSLQCCPMLHASIWTFPVVQQFLYNEELGRARLVVARFFEVAVRCTDRQYALTVEGASGSKDTIAHEVGRRIKEK
jgi:hypothetical protein